MLAVIICKEKHLLDKREKATSLLAYWVWVEVGEYY